MSSFDGSLTPSAFARFEAKNNGRKDKKALALSSDETDTSTPISVSVPTDTVGLNSPASQSLMTRIEEMEKYTVKPSMAAAGISRTVKDREKDRRWKTEEVSADVNFGTLKSPGLARYGVGETQESPTTGFYFETADDGNVAAEQSLKSTSSRSLGSALSSRSITSLVDDQPSSPGVLYSTDALPIQILVGEEEPIMTNTLITLPPPAPPPSFGFVEIPISLQLLEVLDQYRTRKRQQLSAIRSIIGQLIQKHCMKPVGEKDVDLEMFYYDYSAASKNKVVNWFGIILKLHQALLQSGIYPILRHCARAMKQHEAIFPTDEDDPEKVASAGLPSWLTFILYWGPPGNPINHKWRLGNNPNEPSGEIDPENARIGIYVELELELLTLNAHGVFDHYFQCLVILSFQEAINQQRKRKGSVIGTPAEKLKADDSKGVASIESMFDQFFERQSTKPLERYTKTFISSYNDALSHRVTEKKFAEYMAQLSAADHETVISTLNSLELDLGNLLRCQDRRSLKQIERLLVAIHGHENADVREHSIRLLNVIYDENDWQIKEPHQTVLSQVGNPFKVSFVLPENVNLNPEDVILLVRGPPKMLNNRISILTRHNVQYNATTRTFTGEVEPFHRAGYFDWRFGSMGETGRYASLHHIFPDKIQLSQIQGRFIVHPKVSEEFIIEVCIDTEGASVVRIPRGTGEGFTDIVQRGSFGSVAASLEGYKKCGFTTIILYGALERENDSYETSNDRSTPKKSYGGAKELRELSDKAHRLGLKIVLESGLRVSSHGTHRKYDKLLCRFRDTKGRLQIHFDTDGQKNFEDSLLLNYRKVATWDLFVQELSNLGRQYSLDGMVLANSHLLPLVLLKDTVELSRADPDDKSHYTPEEILEAEIIKERGSDSFSYWSTTKRYPNPLFIKLSRALWGKFPSLYLFSDAHWGIRKDEDIARCGLIPISYDLRNAIIDAIGGRMTVEPLYDLFARRKQKGIPVISPMASKRTQFPVATFGKGAWAAFDLICWGPDVVFCKAGEQNGRHTPVNVYDVRSVEDRNAMVSIYGHYEHRIQTRKSVKALQSGDMVPLVAYHKFGQHKRVFAFARCTADDIVIIALNMNNAESTFYIDLRPLAPLLFEGENTIYEIVDRLASDEKKHHYVTKNELILGKQYFSIPAIEPLMIGVAPQGISAATPLRQQTQYLFVDSMGRLLKMLRSDEDASHNHIYQMITKGLASATAFEYAINRIIEDLPPSPTLIADLQYLFYHICKGDQQKEARVIAYLTLMVKRGSEKQREMCKKIIKANKLGPIVFLCPEFGKWSTVGGLGVMVDELTQDMAALGCEVHVISPYYNKNNKGESGYLANDNIRWIQNIQQWIGAERCEVGVHEGYVNGVHLLFLHHLDYFPHVYPSGSPAYLLKVIVLFAKCALEALCKMQTIPAVVVTNDWFTALAPAYAKMGAFGSVFSGTTFIHLIHNLGDGYQGLIYPDRPGDMMNYIHHLSNELLVDPLWDRPIINPSRCALLASDQWATVSNSYKNDLLQTSPLAPLLARFSSPFAVSNGIRKTIRMRILSRVAPSHEAAKAALQEKYFGKSDPKVCVFAFVGRITQQKGVHLIVDAAAELFHYHQGKIQIIIGGRADRTEPYGAYCANKMYHLRAQFPDNFWADPNAFFSDGALVNLGADFGLMPSLFEPGGVVQHEFFAGGTPVIAFKTGGLKDTVFEYNPTTAKGNGFTFEAHTHGDFMWAVNRAFHLYETPESYVALRASAMESVIDTTDVAWAWLREVCRLRKRFTATKEAVKKIRREETGVPDTKEDDEDVIDR